MLKVPELPPPDRLCAAASITARFTWLCIGRDKLLDGLGVACTERGRNSVLQDMTKRWEG